MKKKNNLNNPISNGSLFYFSVFLINIYQILSNNCNDKREL